MRLFIKICCGKNLARGGMGGCDPFCEVRLESNPVHVLHRTKKKLKTRNPTWSHESFEITLRDVDDQVVISVFDYDLLSKPDPLGIVCLRIDFLTREYDPDRVYTEWFPLEKNPEDDKVYPVSGQLKLEFSFSALDKLDDNQTTRELLEYRRKHKNTDKRMSIATKHGLNLAGSGLHALLDDNDGDSSVAASSSTMAALNEFSDEDETFDDDERGGGGEHDVDQQRQRSNSIDKLELEEETKWVKLLPKSMQNNPNFQQFYAKTKAYWRRVKQGKGYQATVRFIQLYRDQVWMQYLVVLVFSIIFSTVYWLFGPIKCFLATVILILADSAYRTELQRKVVRQSTIELQKSRIAVIENERDTDTSLIWLNQTLAKLWYTSIQGTINRELQNETIQGLVDQVLAEQQMEDFRITINAIKLGDVPPTLQSIKVAKSQGNMLVFSAQVDWKSQLLVELTLRRATVPVPAIVKNVQASPKFRISLKLDPSDPFNTVIEFTFLESFVPKMQVKPLKSSFLDSVIQWIISDLIKDSINDMLLWPRTLGFSLKTMQPIEHYCDDKRTDEPITSVCVFDADNPDHRERIFADDWIVLASTVGKMMVDPHSNARNNVKKPACTNFTNRRFQLLKMKRNEDRPRTFIAYKRSEPDKAPITDLAVVFYQRGAHPPTTKVANNQLELVPMVVGAALGNVNLEPRKKGIPIYLAYGRRKDVSPITDIAMVMVEDEIEPPGYRRIKKCLGGSNKADLNRYCGGRTADAYLAYKGGSSPDFWYHSSYNTFSKK